MVLSTMSSTALEPSSNQAAPTRCKSSLQQRRTYTRRVNHDQLNSSSKRKRAESPKSISRTQLPELTSSLESQPAISQPPKALTKKRNIADYFTPITSVIADVRSSSPSTTPCSLQSPESIDFPPISPSTTLLSPPPSSPIFTTKKRARRRITTKPKLQVIADMYPEDRHDVHTGKPRDETYEEIMARAQRPQIYDPAFASMYSGHPSAEMRQSQALLTNIKDEDDIHRILHSQDDHIVYGPLGRPTESSGRLSGSVSRSIEAEGSIAGGSTYSNDTLVQSEGGILASFGSEETLVSLEGASRNLGRSSTGYSESLETASTSGGSISDSNPAFVGSMSAQMDATLTRQDSIPRSEPIPIPSPSAQPRITPNAAVVGGRQQTLDYGQGPATVTCDVCKLFYNRTLEIDRKAHEAHHADWVEGPLFSRLKVAKNTTPDWMTINEVGIMDSIISVDHCDSKVLQDFVSVVLKAVDRDLMSDEIDHYKLWSVLGLAELKASMTASKLFQDVDAGKIEAVAAENSGRFKVFLYISKGRAVGCLLAERVFKGYETARRQIQRDEFGAWPSEVVHQVLEESAESRDVLMGVNKIWVNTLARRKGVATTLLDVAREKFYGAGFRTIMKDEIAWTQLLTSGEALVKGYSGGSGSDWFSWARYDDGM